MECELLKLPVVYVGRSWYVCSLYAQDTTHVHVLTLCSEFLYARYNFHMKLLYYRVQQLYT